MRTPLYKKSSCYALLAGGLYMLVFFSGACSKQDGSQPPALNYEEQRVSSITSKSENWTTKFSYDEEKRLSRIDYVDEPGLSVRFTYNGQLITAQYFKGAAPAPQSDKFTFTTLNGRVVNSRVDRPGGTKYDTYYEYDAQGRMIEIGFRILNTNGSLGGQADAYYSYNSSGNTQSFKLYGGRHVGFKITDTITYSRTWHADKQFISLSNIGFDFFGTAPAGFAYKLNGLTPVIEPFPFIKRTRDIHSNNMAPESYLIPAPTAMQSIKGDGQILDYSWSFTNPEWIYLGWDWTDPEDSKSPYKYDDKGRLIEYSNDYQFTWL